jgi:hypothetical protein
MEKNDQSIEEERVSEVEDKVEELLHADTNKEKNQL